jgi:hypothetical protein
MSMVRIKQHTPQRRTALMSLLTAAAAAVMILVGWRLWRADQPPPPTQRGIADVRVMWECPSGDRFEAPGSCERLACPDNSEPADILLTCRCPEHGTVEVFVRYECDASGRATLSRVRYRDGAWSTPQGGVRCPVCDRRIPAHPGDPAAKWP